MDKNKRDVEYSLDEIFELEPKIQFKQHLINYSSYPIEREEIESIILKHISNASQLEEIKE